ncbi:hypothetical protein WJX81_007606 [Elliptochloris bilobata]|uniref:Uncharacterized protein n=1 Tax=Elliptochloris bilobata TaxID=381761 RepID=A0AAW1SL47_9CHLO
MDNEFAVMDDEAEDFYQLLGVAPTASERDIKRAYHNSMRSCHPDFASSQEDEESATEVCVFLNDIYETLMDKEKRAAYDALAGFTSGSVNPFTDTMYERDHAFVDEFSCIGCRNCNNVCPQTFGMEDDYGRARVMQQRVDPDEKVQEAIDTCPVSCIHWVTAPQLTLLETVMARMERVDVWILMNGGGGGVNPFHEASLAWEKRQALLRRKRTRAQSRGWGPWGGGGGGESEAAGGASAWEGLRGERNLELQRATAVAAATAARRWRDLQRTRRQGTAGLLPERPEP